MSDNPERVPTRTIQTVIDIPLLDAVEQHCLAIGVQRSSLIRKLLRVEVGWDEEDDVRMGKQKKVEATDATE
jgi:hypothetical protein